MIADGLAVVPVFLENKGVKRGSNYFLLKRKKREIRKAIITQ
jgi:hypothetical protein